MCTINNFTDSLCWSDFVARSSNTKDPNISTLEKMLVEKTGLNVFIKNKKNNSGQLIFDYKDLDQLNRLIQIIKSSY